jgi:hemoglobin-like flavoprotein
MFLEPADKDAIRATWRLMVPIQDTAATLFYKRLFELKPEYEGLFTEDMAVQRAKLFAMLSFIVSSLEWAEDAWQRDVERENDLFMVVLALGRRHRELYRVPEESYDAVREALLFSLDDGIGEAFTTEVKSAWTRLYNALAMSMRLGAHAMDMSLRAPGAEVKAEGGV